MATAKDYVFKYEQRGESNEDVLRKLREGEPWFILRAQDRVSSYAISAYADALKSESDKARARGEPELGDDLLKQAIGCQSVATAFVNWQLDHPELVKYPD